MRSALAALRSVLRLRKNETKWRLFWCFEVFVHQRTWRCWARRTRVVGSFMELLLDRGHAALQVWELGHRNRTGKDRPQRPEPEGIGAGTPSELGGPDRLPVGSPGHAAKRAAAGAPAARFGGGPDFGLPGPAVRCAPGHVVVARPHGHGSALRDRDSEVGFRLLAEFFGHGVDRHAATIRRAAGISQRKIRSPHTSPKRQRVHSAGRDTSPTRQRGAAALGGAAPAPG